jgi:2',3'-cyclic-nucleotide 2'-phosphodiesterase/3'-nucleotidase
VALNNAADLYLYPNALHAVKMDGAGLKAWLEKRPNASTASTRPAARSRNWSTPRSRLQLRHADQRRRRYQIDVTQPAGQRIVACTIKGGAVAGAGIPGRDQQLPRQRRRRFPGPGWQPDRMAAPDASRDVLIAYIQRRKS